MAKTVAPVKIKLDVQGLEELTGLKNAFRALEKAVNPADSALDSARQQLRDYAEATKTSVQGIKGQIEALKNLQAQAAVGGRTFRQLSEDIRGYERQLKSVEEQAGRTERALSLSQVRSRFTAGGVPGLQTQLQASNVLLGQATPLTQNYADALGRVLTFETAITRLQERQSVIAAQARTVQFTAARGGVQDLGIQGLLEYANVFGELPNTTAGVSQRLRELKQDFANLDIGGEDYLRTLREINAAQRQLARGERIAAVEAQDRALMGRQNILEAYVERGRGRRLRGAAAGEALAAGELAAARIRSEAPVREISALYRTIGDVGMSKITADIERMGNSYQGVAADIRAATTASNGSIASLQNQRSAWAALRNTVPATSKEYREAGKEIDLLDARLNKLQRSQRFSARQFAQTAGAAISGGIFGGPLGLIGGVTGGILGGTGGAFAGAAVGAQAGMLVQSAAGVAEYAAELNLAKQTLAQVATGQEEYNTLLSNARQISSDYSVRLKETISGYAQVAVAARANGLTLKETDTIYRGLISSATAFGKSQEDIDALVRATVQVLSKGKVSAEELSGQLGERLPGAVAKFAAANNMSLAQLSEAFKKGEVTIAQFVKFAESQLGEYDGLARVIATGPEKAGVRLQIALDNAAETYGSVFARIGALFQDNLAEVVNWAVGNDQEIKKLILKFFQFAEDLDQWAETNKETLSRLFTLFVEFTSGIASLFMDLSRAIIEALGPAFMWLAENLVRGIKGLQQMAKLAGATPAQQRAAQQQVNALGYNIFNDPFGNKRYQALQEALNVELGYARGPEPTVEQFFKGFTPTKFGVSKPGLSGSDAVTGTGGKKGGKSEAEKTAEALARRAAIAKELVRDLQNATKESQAQNEIEKLSAKQAKEKSDFEEKILNLRKGGTNKIIDEQIAQARTLFTAKQKADAEQELFKLFEGIGTLAIKQSNEQQSLSEALDDRKYKLGLITQEEYRQLQLNRERRRIEETYAPFRTEPGIPTAGEYAALDVARQEIAPTPFEEMRQNIAKLKVEMA